jgi:hypothetical protein
MMRQESKPVVYGLTRADGKVFYVGRSSNLAAIDKL